MVKDKNTQLDDIPKKKKYIFCRFYPNNHFVSVLKHVYLLMQVIPLKTTKINCLIGVTQV